MSLVTCKELTLGYEGKEIVENLSFTIESGAYILVVGENGSGKSTLMKTLIGVQTPMKGTLERNELAGPGNIGYLPQQAEAQKDFPASVWEIVLSGYLGKRGLRPFYNRSEKEQAKMYLEQLVIKDLKNRCFRELSGGQKQRVLLARAFAAANTLLLLDEPVAGLDPATTKEMYQWIREWNQKKGIAVFMISHDLENALPDATHILHLGKQCFFGSKQDYMESQIGKWFIGKEGENNA